MTSDVDLLVAVGLEAAVILALLYALLVGQPAAQSITLALVNAKSTEIAVLNARPLPTAAPFRPPR